MEWNKGDTTARQKLRDIMQEIEPFVRDKRGRTLLGLKRLPDDMAS